MNWFEAACDWLSKFFSHPVPIIGCTVGFLLLFILKVISSTSIGKKSLRKLTEMFTTLDSEYKTYKEKSEKLLEDLTKQYEEKIALIAEKKEQTEELLIKVASCINNQKIKTILEEYESKPLLKDISDVVKTEVEKVESNYDILLRRIEALENGKEE